MLTLKLANGDEEYDNLRDTKTNENFCTISPRTVYKGTEYRERFEYVLFKNDNTNGIWLIVLKDRYRTFAAKKKKIEQFYSYHKRGFHKAVFLISTHFLVPYWVAAQQKGLYQDSCHRHNPRPKLMILRWLIYGISYIFTVYGEYILDVNNVKDFREIIQGEESVYTSQAERFVFLFRSRTFLSHWNVTISGEGPVCLATKAFNQEGDFIVLHNQGL